MVDETEPKRGPGRPPKAKEEGEGSVPKASTATLIYSPLENGDPHTVEWAGVTFKANLPKELRYATHGDMIELARGNPHFSVDGKSHRRRTSDREAVPLAGSDVAPEALDDKRMVTVDD